MALSPFDRRALERWDPFREMTRPFHDMMDRMLESTMLWPESTGHHGPPLDVSETDDEYRVCASLSGMRPDDVKISVQGSTVTIEGEHKEEQERKEGERSLYSERRYGSFSRTFTLPMNVDSDKARAEFTNG